MSEDKDEPAPVVGLAEDAYDLIALVGDAACVEPLEPRSPFVVVKPSLAGSRAERE